MSKQNCITPHLNTNQSEVWQNIVLIHETE